MARDHTARERIRQHLVTTGAMADSSGHATGKLMKAIGYEGSSVAFIQLLAAMDHDGELIREIRGKRTYGISATPEAAATLKPSQSPVTPVAIDYDRLARAVVREFVSMLGLPLASSTRTPEPVGSEALRAENVRVSAQRDEYARGLERAREQINALLREAPEGAPVVTGA